MKSSPLEAKAPRLYILLFMVIFTTIYFLTQKVISQDIIPDCFIIDKIQNSLSLFNRFLFDHIKFADKVLIIDSLIGDLAVLFLLGLSIYRKSLRPLFALFFYIFLRQSFQFLTSYPPADHLVWHDPGFPSLFVMYDVEYDFYFSAYVGITLLAAIELQSSRRAWIRWLAFLPFIYQVFSDLITRSHFTMDIYTAIVTAIAVDMFAKKLDRAINKKVIFRNDAKKRLWLFFLMVAGVILYFFIQDTIGKLDVPLCGVSDRVLDWFLPINTYIHTHTGFANAILIYSSFLIDAFMLYLGIKSLLTRNIRPALTLALFFILRQSMQLCIILPEPLGLIWRDPGFPSLLQSYAITNDLYFSGHTGIGLIALIEIARHRITWLTALTLMLFVTIMCSIIVLRFHYTMDIYTALMTVFCVTALSKRLSPHLNQFFQHIDNKLKMVFSSKK